MNSTFSCRTGWFWCRAISCLCLVILSAAHAQVFSANALAYVDLNLAPGANALSNPFNSPDNTVSNLFRGVPDGSYFVAGAAGPTNSFSAAGGWTDPGAIFVLPAGGVLWVPSSAKIAFSGEVWMSLFVGAMAHYPAGTYVLSAIPRADAAVFCDGFTSPCPSSAPPDGTSLMKWSAQAQSFSDLYAYSVQFGWMPSVPTLGPGEAARIVAPLAFYVPAAPAAATRTRRVHAWPSWVRDSNELGIQFSTTATHSYTLLHCPDLATQVWTVVRQDTVSPTGSVARISAGLATNRHGFYSIVPSFEMAIPRLMNPSRAGTEFRFQLYAPAAATYVVQRAFSLPATSWQSIQTLTAGPTNVVSIVDANATAALAYYRVEVR